MSTLTAPTSVEPAPGRHRMPIALLALAMGGFGIGLTEFIVVGLLGTISDDLSVSIPTAGLLITGYAASVAIGAPLMTAAGTRIPRKAMLITLMVIFILGNLLAAVAPNYEVLLAARIIAALNHGAFFGIGSVVAAQLVTPERRASAIALMFTGLTVANVAGVPLGTALGQQFGWRSSFWAVTAVGIIALIGVMTLVPRMDVLPNAGLGRELAAFKRIQVWLAVITTILGFGGVFAAFTFMEPILTEVTGVPYAAVPIMLVIFGVGLFAGNLIGGRFADRRLMPTIYVALGGLMTVLIVFSLTAESTVMTVISLALLGATGFAFVPPIQMRILNKAEGAPALASAANVSAFNVGIAASAWLGGVAIDGGLGFTAPIWIGAILTGSGLIVAVISGLLDRRTTRP